MSLTMLKSPLFINSSKYLCTIKLAFATFPHLRWSDHDTFHVRLLVEVGARSLARAYFLDCGRVFVAISLAHLHDHAVGIDKPHAAPSGDELIETEGA